MASTEIRDRRRIFRYRDLMVRQSVQLKNRISGLLLETGVSYNKRQLHYVGYFHDLMSTNPEVTDSIRPLLKICRDQIEPPLNFQLWVDILLLVCLLNFVFVIVEPVDSVAHTL